MKHKLPAILSDIDGVLYRGTQAIQGSVWAIQRLIKPFTMENGDRVCLPFSLLTNGGGDTEKERTNYVNRIMF